MDRRNQGDEERGDTGELEDVVDGGEGPVVLGCEEEVDKEDDDEGEDDAGEHDLDGEGAGEGGPVLEIRVIGESREGSVWVRWTAAYTHSEPARVAGTRQSSANRPFIAHNDRHSRGPLTADGAAKHPSTPLA